MQQLGVLSLIVLWMSCAAAGLTAMLTYEFTPAQTLTAGSQWPPTSLVHRTREHPVLVMFLHPHCPCSRAGLNELHKLVDQCRTDVDVRIVIVKPDGLPDGWEFTRSYELAEQTPGAILTVDVGGHEAEAFSASTSGEVLLYSAEGRLLFQGGLTAARGHEGESAGHQAILQRLAGDRRSENCTSIFGCALHEKS